MHTMSAFAEVISQRARRIWIIDRHVSVVNASTRQKLGGWIRSRLRNGVEARQRAAIQELSNVKASIGELREQWALQRAAQLSVKNREWTVKYHPPPCQ